jgi:hypothetical protein
MSGLTQPQDFFLYFGQSLGADLQRQIPPGDHGAERMASSAMDHDVGQIPDCGPGFDFGNDAQVLPVALIQLRRAFRLPATLRKRFTSVNCGVEASFPAASCNLTGQNRCRLSIRTRAWR